MMLIDKGMDIYAMAKQAVSVLLFFNSLLVKTFSAQYFYIV